MIYKREGFSFKFELPQGWTDESGNGPRIVSHGSLNEELIVSGAVISGPTTADGFSQIRDAM